MNKTHIENLSPKLGLIFLYFTFYILSATVFQLRSETPPWVDGSPIEYFTGGLLWMSSIVCLLLTGITRNLGWKSWFWLAGCGALAFLALDEFFIIHEKSSRIVGDDDHLKVAQWVVTGGMLYFVHRFISPLSNIKPIFLIGFITHGLYVFTDLGDGDYFTMPLLSLTQLRWTEEYLELFALILYFVGLMFLFVNVLKATLLSDLQDSTTQALHAQPANVGQPISEERPVS